MLWEFVLPAETSVWAHQSDFSAQIHWRSMFQLFGFRSRTQHLWFPGRPRSAEAETQERRQGSDNGGLCPSDRLECGPGNTFPDSFSLAVKATCLLWINALNSLPCYWAAPQKNQLWVSTSVLLNIPANYSLSTTTRHHSKNHSQGPWPSSRAHTTVCRRQSVVHPHRAPTLQTQEAVSGPPPSFPISTCDLHRSWSRPGLEVCDWDQKKLWEES